MSSRLETKQVATVDAETDPFLFGRIPKPFIFGFYDGERFRTFDTAEELVEFLRPQRLIVFAHNGGKFDWHFLLRHFDAYQEILNINGRIARFMIGECEFRDSYSILPVPLSAYKKDSIDITKMEADVRHLHMPEIIRYLRGDCVYLHELVTAFRATYGNGITLASCAMRVWEQISGEQCKNQDAEFYHTNHKFYYGGRVEVFKRGVIQTPFTVADITSAYPFAMLHTHAWGHGFQDVDCKISKPEQIHTDHFYSLESKSVGAFPFRDGGSLAFPNDGERREFNVTGWELLAAMETGALKARDFTVLYERRFGNSINFKSYVMRFFKMKADAKAAGDTATELFAKLFLNSLYGKLCAGGDSYASFGIVPYDDTERFINPERAAASLKRDKKGLHLGRSAPPKQPELRCPRTGNLIKPAGRYWNFNGMLGPWSLVSGPIAEDKANFYNVATGASITGFVRAYLFRHLHALGGEKLYCDTDSIAFLENPANSKHFKFGKGLGEWADEGAEVGGFDHGAIAGKKLYAFHSRLPNKKKAEKGDKYPNWKRAHKGVKLKPPEIVAVAEGAEVKYYPEAASFPISTPVAKPGRAPRSRFTVRTVKATG